MGFESITRKLRGKSSGRPKGSGHQAILTISGIPASVVNDRKYGNDRLQFRLTPELWKQAELEPGQKVEVLFDRSRSMAMITPSDHGYTVTIHRRKFAEPDLYFIIPHDESTGFPFYYQQTGMEDVEVKDGSIFFRVVVPGDPSFESLGKTHQGKKTEK